MFDFSILLPVSSRLKDLVAEWSKFVVVARGQGNCFSQHKFTRGVWSGNAQRVWRHLWRAWQSLVERDVLCLHFLLSLQGFIQRASCWQHWPTRDYCARLSSGEDERYHWNTMYLWCAFLICSQTTLMLGTTKRSFGGLWSSSLPLSSIFWQSSMRTPLFLMQSKYAVGTRNCLLPKIQSGSGLGSGFSIRSGRA